MVFVALLRGINVGGHRKVEMSKLKTVFEKSGFTDVKTYINSGNVIFATTLTDKTNLVSKIEKSIQNEFGFEVAILLRNLPEMKKLVGSIPEKWINDKQIKCDVMFLWPAVDSRKILKELDYDPKIEDVKYFQGAVVWRIDRKLAPKSKMFKLAGGKLHKQMTTRNPNTVRKLYQLMKP
jgi:uncharacterized protein (DUF1697 family)